MVNIVFHSSSVAAATDDSGELEAQEDLPNDPEYEVNPEVFQSCLGGPNSTETISLTKKLIKRLGAVTNIMSSGKHNFEEVDIFWSDILMEKPKQLSSKQIKIITQNFADPIIGCWGRVGKVYRGKIPNFYNSIVWGEVARAYRRKLPNDVQVAVKVLNDNLQQEEQFMAEVSILGRTYHRNIVKLLGVCFEEKMKALVYEYIENGSLGQFLFHDRHVYSTVWRMLYEIMLGVAKGLSYLHECCDLVIIHMYINPDNILLDSNFCPKIADFKLAHVYDRDEMDNLPYGCRGTMGYVAPEQIETCEATYKCDVFSFGVTLFEIVSKRRCFESVKRRFLVEQVWEYFKKGKLEEFIIELGIEVRDREQAKKVFMVALWCIQYKPEDRPSMSYVVKILEGEIEITEPPCPFPYMASPMRRPGFLARCLSYSSEDSNEDSQVSPFMASPLSDPGFLARCLSYSSLSYSSGDSNEDSQVSTQWIMHDSTIAPHSAVVDCDIQLLTPTMEKFEIEMASSSESY